MHRSVSFVTKPLCFNWLQLLSFQVPGLIYLSDIPVLSVVHPAKAEVDKGKGHFLVSLQYVLVLGQPFLYMLQTDRKHGFVNNEYS